MTEPKPPAPKYFWLIAVVALVWNLIGVATYVAQVTLTEEQIRQMPIEQQPLYTDIPAWATSAYAIAVSAGVIGCILLLFRSAWAVPVFLLSLAGILVQMYHAFVIAGVYDILGPSSVVMPTVIIAIGVGLIWYARIARERGWIS